MKYTLLNCWTDENKGDLGILITTIQKIKNYDMEAEISAVSCYTKGDPYFQNCHKILKRYVDVMYPSLLGVLMIKIGRFTLKNPFAKGLAGICDFVRFGICYLLPDRLCTILLSSEEKNTLAGIKAGDLAISKGGTIFYDNGSLRGRISLLRNCLFYMLLHKMNCRYVILGQSFGPFSSKLCSLAVEKVINESEKTFLRERNCIKEYSNFKYEASKVGFSNDIAFALPEEEIGIETYGFDVGMTLRPFTADSLDSEIYFKEIIKYLIKRECHIHFFLQVIDENEPDIQFTDLIYNSFSKEEKKYITYHKNNYLPQQLKNLYKRMKIFIGTRLHSTIFALGAGVPALCHVYQGTKAQGIYRELEMEGLVIFEADINKGIDKIEDLICNETEYREKLKDRLGIVYDTINKAVQEVIDLASK